MIKEFKIVAICDACKIEWCETGRYLPYMIKKRDEHLCFACLLYAEWAVYGELLPSATREELHAAGMRPQAVAIYCSMQGIGMPQHLIPLPK